MQLSIVPFDAVVILYSKEPGIVHAFIIQFANLKCVRLAAIYIFWFLFFIRAILVKIGEFMRQLLTNDENIFSWVTTTQLQYTIEIMHWPPCQLGVDELHTHTHKNIPSRFKSSVHVMDIFILSSLLFKKLTGNNKMFHVALKWKWVILVWIRFLRAVFALSFFRSSLFFFY